MQKIQALYKEGKIIPLEKINLEEGEKICILILEEGEKRKEKFFKDMEQYQFPLPENYRFSREELYER